MLVIKSHNFEWSKPIKAKLEDELPSYLKKIWRPEVIVINHDVAIRQNLAVNKIA